MVLHGKKLCIFLPSLEHGGAERRMTLLAIELKKRGYAIDVIVLRQQGEFESLLNDAGVPIKNVDKGGRLDLLGAAIRAKAIFADNRYDVVLSCLPSANMFSTFVKWVDKKTPLIWGIAAADMPMDAYGSWAKFGAKLQNFLARYADNIVVNSYKANEISIQQGISASKLCVIQNGVDTERFQPDINAGEQWRRQNAIPLNAKVIGIVARLDPAKGIEVFLDAVHLIELRRSKSKERVQCYYLIFGSGDSEYVDNLRVSIQEHPIYGDRLFLFENIQVDREIYNAIDVISITSISESFPNVMLEAMSSGTRLVATNVGDCKSVIKNYGNVIPVGDSAALSVMWERLLDSEHDELEQTQVRNYIINEFSIGRMVDKFEEQLMASLLQKERQDSKAKMEKK